MKGRRVVVTGLGALSPIGNTIDENWEAAKAGKSGIAPVTRFDVEGFASKIAGEVKDFDGNGVIEKKERKKLDLFSQYALVACHEAWADAQLDNPPYEATKMACILGIGIGGLATLEKYHEALMKGGPKKVSPFLIPAMISNLGPGNIAMRYGLMGINYTLTSACASATHAIGEAAKLIAEGTQDMIVTGGTESAVTPIGLSGFCAMKALSTRNDEPQKASRPFDKDRDGFVLGEGAAIIILESLENARKRGAKIYAEVIGYGSSCDAYHITAPSIDGAGAVACMDMALKDAGLKPEELHYINAHGTSTEANDVTETMAIKKVFGPWAKEGLVISSTKSMTGHLLGAAGAIEAFFTIKAITDSIIPPTANLDEPDEKCDLNYTPCKAAEMSVNAAMSNSFGFGGTNASIVFGAVRD